MNDFFNYFFRKHGFPENSYPLTAEELGEIASTLPAQLQEFYSTYGRCTLRSGRIQACHPQDLKPVLKLALGNDPALSCKSCHAFAYTAFGEIYFYSTTYGCGAIEVLTGNVYCENLTSPATGDSDIEYSVYVPFSMSDESLDLDDIDGAPLFKKAQKKLGKIGVGECYGFVPVLDIGGMRSITTLKKERAAEHFSIIAQLKKFELLKTLNDGTTEIVRTIT
ncbi:T6SS immunity protein Tdi1 domain-containing protein [Pseudomonas promysalinigenes]|uniref:T6SS immunity protein Tdi1 domain-containing protein n=1 Tax=Pseudomonas promysalinigenes TaxID=485898 RepID=UPI0037CCB06E